RHTRFDCDWSSDVCSSDLAGSPCTTISSACLPAAIVPSLAEFLGESASVGTIAAGKQADLIVVQGDPAANINDIEKVELVFKDRSEERRVGKECRYRR